MTSVLTTVAIRRAGARPDVNKHLSINVRKYSNIEMVLCVVPEIIH